MLQFRVTKYDPAHRDIAGAYLLDDWTSYSDIGGVFGDAALTLEQYVAVEDSYVSAARHFLKESGVSYLRVVGLENQGAANDAPPDGAEVTLDAIGPVLRGLLREHFWCRLEAVEAFVHVGWDYYMYVGVPRECPVAITAAIARGLFVEPFPSPYGASAA